MLGFRDAAAQGKLDEEFLQVPSATLAGEELKTLTAAPHIAGSKEDFATANTSHKNFAMPASKPKSFPIAS